MFGEGGVIAGASEVLGDIGELHSSSQPVDMIYMPSTIKYTQYLETLSQEELLPHVYLHLIFLPIHLSYLLSPHYFFVGFFDVIRAGYDLNIGRDM